jgi:hypothetical protein
MIHTMTSSGLVMVMTKAPGQCSLIAAPTWHAGGDDHHVGALDRGVVVGAGDIGVVALDRGALDDVERLALRHPVDDVEQHDVAELLDARQQSQRAADLPGADQRDLLACHVDASWLDVPGLARFTRPGKAGSHQVRHPRALLMAAADRDEHRGFRCPSQCRDKSVHKARPQVAEYPVSDRARR